MGRIAIVGLVMGVACCAALAQSYAAARAPMLVGITILDVCRIDSAAARSRASIAGVKLRCSSKRPYDVRPTRINPLSAGGPQIGLPRGEGFLTPDRAWVQTVTF